ncbi:MAG: RNA polymerase sigma factor [Solirubrobacteraceae bacterium]
MTPLLSSALLATQSDERLLALASAGHDRAFEAIVERYRRPLSRYLRRLLSAALAEDVLQATFVNAWRSLHRGTQVRELRPWLYRIAHNQAVNALARAGAGLALADEAAAVATTAGPEAEVEQRDVLSRALDAIAGLPERQRAALVAVAVEDRPHPDVARELGLTEGALRQLVHRARTTLRAAATAMVPMPLVTAAASSGHDVTVARVAEVAAGAGGAGLGVKTGAVILATGALVVSGPGLPEHHPHPGAPATAAIAATPAHAAAADPAASGAHPILAAARVPAPTARPPALRHGRTAAAPSRHHGRALAPERRRGSGDGADGRLGNTGDDGRHTDGGGSETEHHTSSGPSDGGRDGSRDGGGETSTSSRGSDGSSGGSTGETSGSGSSNDGAPTQTTTQPAPDSSGSGDGGDATATSTTTTPTDPSLAGPTGDS